MSRHPMHVLQLSLCILGQAEEYGNFVTVTAVPEAMSEIQIATKADPTLSKVIGLITTGI